MNIRIKGRNWWGKRPKNSWSAKNKMHSILKAMRNGEDMTELFDETKEALISKIRLLEATNESLEQSLRILEKRELFLLALEAAGVDNWTGYEYAFEIMDDWKAENDTRT